MLSIRAIKKDILYNVMLQQMYSLNYVWMRMEGIIQQRAPEVYGSDEYYELFEDYGSEEGRRLIKALDLPRKEIKDLARFLKYSHWAIFENIEIAGLSAVASECAHSIARRRARPKDGAWTTMLVEPEARVFGMVSSRASTPVQESREFSRRLKPDLKVDLLSPLANGWFHWSDALHSRER